MPSRSKSPAQRAASRAGSACSPYHACQAAPEGTVVQHADITAAHRARAGFVEREAHRRSILETVPDAMIVIDECSSIQSFGTTAERLFGSSWTGSRSSRFCST